VQKGTLDFPALIHAPIEKFLLRYLCRTSITPNQLTIAWAIAACLTTIFFATGHLIWGIVLALVVGILDGLDGKQARIKVETTAGGKIEHHLDSFFDVVWPIALAFHFYSSGRLPTAFYYLAVLLIGEGVDGIAKAIIYSGAGRLMTAPSMFDRFVRLIGGRRNIYIWVLAIALILGAPEKALIVMAWWELMTAAIDIPQAARMWILRQKTR
jgi:phosphatidylglycerophosphate synthase